MRPHVEFIFDHDLVWWESSLPVIAGAAHDRHLSLDEESGAASLQVRLAPGGVIAPSHADDFVEIFVLSGRLDIEGESLNERDYAVAPPGAELPSLSSQEGALFLLFREAFTTTTPGTGSRFEVVYTEEIPWESNAMRKGLHSKVLLRSTEYNRMTAIGRGDQGWRDERLDVHGCAEEGYTLRGCTEYNFGPLTPGSYFYRPALVKHGDWSVTEGPAEWLIRTDCAELDTEYVGRSTVEVREEAADYDSSRYPLPVAGLPVRSRSAGDWDGHGR